MVSESWGNTRTNAAASQFSSFHFRGSLPPTRNDTWYRHEVHQGRVDDGNAYALGGISGHAGLFSNVDDMRILMHVREHFLSCCWLFRSNFLLTFFIQAWLFEEKPSLLNATTIKLWTTEYNHSVSCRALGWSTNDQTVVDRGWDGLCGSLSSRTFLHVGYTGTQICADPERGLYTILLTNRVYPSGDNVKIEDFRRSWNDLIVKIYDNLQTKKNK